MDFILDVDRSLFFFINSHKMIPVLDPIMVLLSSNWTYLCLSFCLILWAFRTKSYSLFAIIGVALICALLVDFVSFHFLKPFFGRLRPCQEEPQYVRVLMGCAGRLGFPSNHATNAAAVFVSFYLLATQRRLVMMIGFLAVLICVSRIYIGVHYPLDVISGLLFGGILSVPIVYSLKPLLRNAGSRFLNDQISPAKLNKNFGR